LCAIKADFAQRCSSAVNVNVTETRRIDLHLQVARVGNNVQVSAEPQMVQTDNSALGRVVSESGQQSSPGDT
jgi:hypothetical protein